MRFAADPSVLLRDPALGAAAKFEEGLSEGVRLRLESVGWPDAFQQAENLARRFARTLRPGGHDLVLEFTDQKRPGSSDARRRRDRRP